MVMVNVSDIYAYVHQTLREDGEIARLMGFDSSTTILEMSKRIQKRSKPDVKVRENLPIISFYKIPGLRERNHLTYTFPIVFNIFVLNGYEETAMEIADRINAIFDGQYVDLKCINSQKSEFDTMGETDSDYEDIFQFFTEIIFTISLEG